MKGLTFELADKVYATAIILDGGGKILLTRHDGRPHRVVDSRSEAEQLAGSFSAQFKTHMRHKDHAWDRAVTFSGQSFAAIQAASDAEYSKEVAEELAERDGPTERRAAELAEQRAEVERREAALKKRATDRQRDREFDEEARELSDRLRAVEDEEDGLDEGDENEGSGDEHDG